MESSLSPISQKQPHDFPRCKECGSSLGESIRLLGDSMRFCNRCGSPYPPKIYNFGLSQGVLTLSKNDVFNWMYALVMLVAVGSFWGALTSGLFVAFSTYFPYLGLSIGSWFVGLIVGCFSKQRWILLAITITIGGICLGILIFGFLWIAGLAFVAGCPSYNC